jgi:hypothetical protein
LWCGTVKAAVGKRERVDEGGGMCSHLEYYKVTWHKPVETGVLGSKCTRARDMGVCTDKRPSHGISVPPAVYKPPPPPPSFLPPFFFLTQTSLNLKVHVLGRSLLSKYSAPVPVCLKKPWLLNMCWSPSLAQIPTTPIHSLSPPSPSHLTLCKTGDGRSTSSLVGE